MFMDLYNLCRLNRRTTHIFCSTESNWTRRKSNQCSAQSPALDSKYLPIPIEDSLSNSLLCFYPISLSYEHTHVHTRWKKHLRHSKYVHTVQVLSVSHQPISVFSSLMFNAFDALNRSFSLFLSSSPPFSIFFQLVPGYITFCPSC